MMSLYKISHEYQNLFDLLGDNEIDDQLVIDAIEKKEIELKEKLKMTSYCVANLESLYSQIVRREKQLKKLKSSVESRLNRLSSYLIKHMQACGEKEVITEEFTLGLKINRESTVIDDIQVIPKEYLKEKITYSPVKLAIKKAILSGEEVPGAHLEKTVDFVIR